MRTDAERTEQILRRTAELRQQEQNARQRRWIELGSVAACLALVVCIGAMMPGWTGGPVTVTVSPMGTASVLSENGADGYILVGLLSFLLGCCVTILLYRLRHRKPDQKHPGDHDEL